MIKKGRQTKMRRAAASATGGAVVAGDRRSTPVEGAPSPVRVSREGAGSQVLVATPELGPRSFAPAVPVAIISPDPFPVGPRPVALADSACEFEDAGDPPMSDLDAHFFEAALSPFESEPEPPKDPRLIAVRSIAAQRRRAHFTKYVAGAVAVCGALCVAALVKASAGRGDDARSVRARTLPAQVAGFTPVAIPSPPPAMAPDPGPVASTSPAPVASVAGALLTLRSASPAMAPDTRPVASTSPAPVASAAGALLTLPPAPSAAPSVLPEAPAAPAPPSAPAVANAADRPPEAAVDPASTAREAASARELARTELDRGHPRQSIVAGERSVALDPTDGEAWLVLGAAYQQRGAIADARRCYKACLDQGKRGPRGECSAMLR